MLPMIQGGLPDGTAPLAVLLARAMGKVGTSKPAFMRAGGHFETWWQMRLPGVLTFLLKA